VMVNVAMVQPSQSVSQDQTNAARMNLLLSIIRAAK